jgi:hypothetical protein
MPITGLRVLCANKLNREDRTSAYFRSASAAVNFLTYRAGIIAVRLGTRQLMRKAAIAFPASTSA